MCFQMKHRLQVLIAYILIHGIVTLFIWKLEMRNSAPFNIPFLSSLISNSYTWMLWWNNQIKLSTHSVVFIIMTGKPCNVALFQTIFSFLDVWMQHMANAQLASNIQGFVRGSRDGGCTSKYSYLHLLFERNYPKW